jgi:hypothetical protein
MPNSGSPTNTIIGRFLAKGDQHAKQGNRLRAGIYRAAEDAMFGSGSLGYHMSRFYRGRLPSRKAALKETLIDTVSRPYRNYNYSRWRLRAMQDAEGRGEVKSSQVMVEVIKGQEQELVRIHHTLEDVALSQKRVEVLTNRLLYSKGSGSGVVPSPSNRAEEEQRRLIEQKRQEQQNGTNNPLGGLGTAGLVAGGVAAGAAARAAAKGAAALLRMLGRGAGAAARGAAGLLSRGTLFGLLRGAGAAGRVGSLIPGGQVIGGGLLALGIAGSAAEYLWGDEAKADEKKEGDGKTDLGEKVEIEAQQYRIKATEMAQWKARTMFFDTETIDFKASKIVFDAPEIVFAKRKQGQKPEAPEHRKTQVPTLGDKSGRRNLGGPMTTEPQTPEGRGYGGGYSRYSTPPLNDNGASSGQWNSGKVTSIGPGNEINPKEFVDPRTNPNVNPEALEHFKGRHLPAALRHNNPGAVSITGDESKSFAARQPGYVGKSPRPANEGGYYARYASPEHGVHASSENLKAYGRSGRNTLSSIVSRWAVGGNAAYIAALSKFTGYGPNDKIDLEDPSVRAKIIAGMSAFEAGSVRNGKIIPLYKPEVYERGSRGEFTDGKVITEDTQKKTAALDTKTDASAVGKESITGEGTNIRYTNKNATRNQRLTPELEGKVKSAVEKVYGPGYTAEVYSGGQDSHGPRRTGSHRHDHGGAGDIRIYDPQGKQVQGDELGRLGQYWRATKAGGVGMTMRGGGIHLDERQWVSRNGRQHWHYGYETERQREALRRGERGEMPRLYQPPEQQQPTVREPNIEPPVEEKSPVRAILQNQPGPQATGEHKTGVTEHVSRVPPNVFQEIDDMHWEYTPPIIEKDNSRVLFERDSDPSN